MLHPHTELRYVSAVIGYGVFATQRIPKGTMTWVRDELDRVVSPEAVTKLSEPNRNNFLKYTYRTRTGDYFFCWDLTRYVNHSFNPNTMLTALGFEIALRDIEAGEEISNDYGTLNIIEPFECAYGAEDRKFVRPDDLLTHYKEWDQKILKAMETFDSVEQLLKVYLSPEQNLGIEQFRKDKRTFPSVLENYFRI